MVFTTSNGGRTLNYSHRYRKMSNAVAFEYNAWRWFNRSYELTFRADTGKFLEDSFRSTVTRFEGGLTGKRVNAFWIWQQ